MFCRADHQTGRFSQFASQCAAVRDKMRAPRSIANRCVAKSEVWRILRGARSRPSSLFLCSAQNAKRNIASDSRTAPIATWISCESLDAPTDRPPGDELSAPVLLWSGFHTGTLEEIRAALDEAEIAYNDEPLEARLLYASMRHPLEIYVQKADFDAAKKLIAKRLAGDEGADDALAGLEMEPNDFPIVGARRVGSAGSTIPTNANSASPADATEELEDPDSDQKAEIPEQPYDPTERVDEPPPSDPEDKPSIEVWTGTETDIADYVAMCFREDGIRFARFPDSAGGIRILVFPDREERARLIVREVVDGKLPE